MRYFLAIISILLFTNTFSAHAQANTENFRAYTQPTEQHLVLDKLLGEWKEIIETYGNEGQVNRATGKVVAEQLFGGRFIEMNSTINFNSINYKRRYIIGYDISKKSYFMHIYDNDLNYPQYAGGSFDEATQTFIFTGEIYNAFINAEQEFKIELIFNKNNTCRINRQVRFRCVFRC